MFRECFFNFTNVHDLSLDSPQACEIVSVLLVIFGLPINKEPIGAEDWQLVEELILELRSLKSDSLATP